MFTAKPIGNSQNRLFVSAVENVDFLGKAQFSTKFTFADIEVGGLFGLVYDESLGDN